MGRVGDDVMGRVGDDGLVGNDRVRMRSPIKSGMTSWVKSGMTGQVGDDRLVGNDRVERHARLDRASLSHEKRSTACSERSQNVAI